MGDKGDNYGIANVWGRLLQTPVKNARETVGRQGRQAGEFYCLMIDAGQVIKSAECRGNSRR